MNYCANIQAAQDNLRAATGTFSGLKRARLLRTAGDCFSQAAEQSGDLPSLAEALSGKALTYYMEGFDRQAMLILQKISEAADYRLTSRQSAVFERLQQIEAETRYKMLAWRGVHDADLANDLSDRLNHLKFKTETTIQNLSFDIDQLSGVSRYNQFVDQKRLVLAESYFDQAWINALLAALALMQKQKRVAKSYLQSSWAALANFEKSPLANLSSWRNRHQRLMNLQQQIKRRLRRLQFGRRRPLILW